MNEHQLPNLGPLVFMVIFVAAAMWRQVRRIKNVPSRSVTAAAPPPAAVPLARRRLAEPAPPVRPRPKAPPAPAATAIERPALEAAAAFPPLDLSLGDEPVAAAPVRRARRRLLGAVGGPNWGANAIVAAEVLGTPVGLRPGATVGVPHAF